MSTTDDSDRSMIEHIRRHIAQMHQFDESGRAICERFQLYLDDARSGLTLDRAFGLVPSAGCDPWFEAEAFARSHVALRQLAMLLVPDGRLQVAAAAVQIAIVRYEEISWPQDRELADMPSKYAGKEKQFLFLAFHERRGNVPRGLTRLKEILAPAYEKQKDIASPKQHLLTDFESVQSSNLEDFESRD